MRKVAVFVLVATATFLLSGDTALGKDTKNPANGVGKVLIQGAPIHGANGIMFDGEDRLHIASVFGREIVVMNPKNGAITKRLGPEIGVEGPDDLAFGPDGSLYWTAIMEGEVGRLSPSGIKTGQFVGGGVNPITFSDDGRLFVAQCFGGIGLYEVDPDFGDPPRLITDTIGLGSPCALNGMDWGPDGYLYGPRWFIGDVVKVDVDTGDYETVVAGFGGPAAVKFDSQGRLHVLDTVYGEVVRVHSDNGAPSREVVARLRPGLDNLAFDSQDRLYVSSYIEGFIARVLPSGKWRYLSPGGLTLPGGVAVMPGHQKHERVFVADGFSVKEFDGLTGKALSMEMDIFGYSPLYSPFSVAADGPNLITTSIMWGGTVQVWDPEELQVLETYGGFGMPTSALRFGDDIAVANMATGSVVYASDHTPIATGFFGPVGLAASDGNLWVTDVFAGTVSRIAAAGTPISPELVAFGLSAPKGMAYHPDGCLLVVESGAGRLSRVDPASGAVTPVSENLELGLQFPTWVFSDVAIGATGAIFISGDKANVLYRLKPLE